MRQVARFNHCIPQQVGQFASRYGLRAQLQLLQIITQRFGGATEPSETLAKSIVQILPDPPLFGLADTYDLMLQPLGMF